MMPIGRMTRSRASIFQPLNISTNHSNIPDVLSKSDVSASESVSYKSDKFMLVNKTEQKRKRRRKQTKEADFESNITENFTLVDSVRKSTSPVEITKNNVPHTNELSSIVSTDECRAKQKSKKTKAKKSFITDNTDLVSTIASYNIPEKVKLTPGSIQCNDKENSEKTTKRGRKKKTVENPIEVKKVDKDDIINIDVESDLDNETQLQYKSRRKRVEKTNSISKEDNEVMKTSNWNKETFIETNGGLCEPKKPKRGKKEKGKRLSNKSPTSLPKRDIKCLSGETLKNVAETSNDNETSDLFSNSRSKRKTKSPLGECNVNNLTVTLNTSASQLDLCFESNIPKSNSVPRKYSEEQDVMPVPVTPTPVALHTNDESPKLTTNKKQLRSSAEQNKFSLPQRSGTFIVDECDTDPSDSTGLCEQTEQSAKQNQYDQPKRGNTFTLDENEESSPRRSSLRFTADPALQKSIPQEDSTKKWQKSIGKRIMSSTAKIAKPVHQNIGSSVKKTIQKKTTTPGSTYKSTLSSCKKLPNFKLIHQKLFGAMESLDENEKRKKARAQGLINSPIVPKCAFPHQSPRQTATDTVTSSTTIFPKVQMTPANSGGPSQNTKTLSTNKQQNGPTSFNRFGFKNRIDKAEARKVIQNKLPLVSVEDRKKQERGLLKGVRTNRRFLLQMKMRQNV